MTASLTSSSNKVRVHHLLLKNHIPLTNRLHNNLGHAVRVFLERAFTAMGTRKTSPKLRSALVTYKKVWGTLLESATLEDRIAANLASWNIFRHHSHSPLR
jgi:hypothetical protein